NTVLERVTELSKDECFQKFIKKENLSISFQNQVNQLQIPLQDRLEDIRKALNNIKFLLGLFEGIAERKFQSCKSVNETCIQKTNQWLESTIYNLSCAVPIYPNCSSLSVRKRATCPPKKFKCGTGYCITASFFCDGDCDCADCKDEPPNCVSSCSEFRCGVNYRCISLSKKCNGIDDCGDGTDEEGCLAPIPTTPSYTHVNCSIDTGNFLCNTNKCISLEQVCDGYNDCGDWSDESDRCNHQECSQECRRSGGVCFTGPRGFECLNECPPGTYETSQGCGRYPEAPLPTLVQILDDTPRLITRYAARLKFLKKKTIMAVSESLRELVRCKKEEFTLLSNVNDFSTIIHEEKELMEDKKYMPLQ
ncbi:uncharacterized protein, partial [Halyomorpha halys]|uniref:uncharacterized protein n=1 Tax=Halyomorpha halys TaxID=286706 RepID=UPI0034D1B759